MKAFIHQPGMYDIELKKGHTFRSSISSLHNCRCPSNNSFWGYKTVYVVRGLFHINSIIPVNFINITWIQISQRYDIWFGGEPPPTVTWEREGTVIQVSRLSYKHENDIRELSQIWIWNYSRANVDKRSLKSHSTPQLSIIESGPPEMVSKQMLTLTCSQMNGSPSSWWQRRRSIARGIRWSSPIVIRSSTCW